LHESGKIGPDTILKIIVNLNLHLDRIIWAQIQTLIALEGAVLGAAYVTRGSSVSIAVLFVGLEHNPVGLNHHF